jgi:hypothetical protein
VIDVFQPVIVVENVRLKIGRKEVIRRNVRESKDKER